MNLAWNCLSFSSSGRSFAMGGRMVILKRTNGKRGAQTHLWWGQHVPGLTGSDRCPPAAQSHSQAQHRCQFPPEGTGRRTCQGPGPDPGVQEDGQVTAPRPTPCSMPTRPCIPHLSTLHCSWGQLHSREGIHGALHWVAADARSLIEDLLREFSLGCQLSQHFLPLLQPQEGIMEEGFVSPPIVPPKAGSPDIFGLVCSAHCLKLLEGRLGGCWRTDHHVEQGLAWHRWA